MSLDAQLALELDVSARQRLEDQRTALLKRARGTLLGPDGLLADLLLDWNMGFIRSAVVPGDGVHLDCLVELSKHPSGSMLEALECSPPEFARYLEDGVTPLRELTLRGERFSQPGFVINSGLVGELVGEVLPPVLHTLGSFGVRVPRLRRLVLSGLCADVSGLSSATLERLELVGRTRLEGLKGLVDRLPRLRVLRAETKNDDDVTGLGESITGALQVGTSRTLQVLDLGEFPSELFETLRHEPLRVGLLDLRRLERVDDRLARRLILALPSMSSKIRRILIRKEGLSVARGRQLLEALRTFNRRE